MRQPNPERGLFMDIQKKQFMNIYDSLMDIFDEKTNSCSPILQLVLQFIIQIYGTPMPVFCTFC